MYKRLLDREPRRAADGVKYFRDTLRPHFIKEAQSVFLWRFYQFTRATRVNIEMVKWIGKFSLLLKRLRDARMNMLPLSTMSEERRQNQHLADVTQENVERQRRSAEVLDPNAPETRDKWYATQESNHVVEDYAEDEFGLGQDEATGEQGYIDDERSCFWTWDDNEYAWQSRPFKGRQVKRRKGKGKGKGKGRSEITGRAFFGDEQAQDPEWWSEEDSAWWSKGKKGKKG